MKTFQILTPEFLPDASYFCQFLKSNTVLIADHFQYKKRSYLTRSSPLKNGQQLTIPVKHTGFKKTIYEKEVAYIESWQRKHLTAIHHNYHLLPFFDDYYQKIEEIYRKHHKYLNHLLFDQIQLFLTILKISCKIKLTSDQGFNKALEESLVKFSKDIGGAIFLYRKEDINNGFISLEKIQNAQIKTQALAEVLSSLPQNTNILEFIFTYGPEAAFILRER